MSWAKATVEIKPASVGTGVKVSLKKIRGSAAKMTITVTGAAKKDIGWADGDGIEILIGEKEHHGLLRLRKNKSAAQVAVKEREAVRGGKYLTLSLGHQPAFIDRAEPAQWCQWEVVEEGWVEVVLPRWADATGPRKSAPAPPAEPGKASARPAANVTSALMGDPPPGRREMLQRVGEMKA